MLGRVRSACHRKQQRERKNNVCVSDSSTYPREHPRSSLSNSPACTPKMRGTTRAQLFRGRPFTPNRFLSQPPFARPILNMGSCLGAAGDFDRCGEMNGGATLRQKFGRYPKLAVAEIPVGSQRRVLALWQCQHETANGYIRNRLEGTARDSLLADERGAYEINGHPISLQHDDQTRERFTAVTYEVHRAFQRH